MRRQCFAIRKGFPWNGRIRTCGSFFPQVSNGTRVCGDGTMLSLTGRRFFSSSGVLPTGFFTKGVLLTVLEETAGFPYLMSSALKKKTKTRALRKIAKFFARPLFLHEIFEL